MGRLVFYGGFENKKISGDQSTGFLQSGLKDATVYKTVTKPTKPTKPGDGSVAMVCSHRELRGSARTGVLAPRLDTWSVRDETNGPGVISCPPP